jgi:hypothetical protein
VNETCLTSQSADLSGLCAGGTIVSRSCYNNQANANACAQVSATDLSDPPSWSLNPLSLPLVLQSSSPTLFTICASVQLFLCGQTWTKISTNSFMPTGVGCLRQLKISNYAVRSIHLSAMQQCWWHEGQPDFLQVHVWISSQVGWVVPCSWPSLCAYVFKCVQHAIVPIRCWRWSKERWYSCQLEHVNFHFCAWFTCRLELWSWIIKHLHQGCVKAPAW